jgi:hypothetical protein
MMPAIQFLQSVSSWTTWTAWGMRSIAVHPKRFTRRLTVNKWRCLYESQGALEVMQRLFQTRNCCSAVQKCVICTPLCWVKKTVGHSSQALGGKGRRGIQWQLVVEQACVLQLLYLFWTKPSSLFSFPPPFTTALSLNVPPARAVGARLYQLCQP